MSCSWCGSCCLEEGFPGVLCSVSTSRLAPCHSLNRHPNLSASWLGREMPSLSGTHLSKVLSSCCASWAVIQPSLPALVGVLWGGAVLCPLQPPARLYSPLERSSGAGLPGLLVCLMGSETFWLQQPLV